MFHVQPHFLNHAGPQLESLKRADHRVGGIIGYMQGLIQRAMVVRSILPEQQEALQQAAVINANPGPPPPPPNANHGAPSPRQSWSPPPPTTQCQCWSPHHHHPMPILEPLHHPMPILEPPPPHHPMPILEPPHHPMPIMDHPMPILEPPHHPMPILEPHHHPMQILEPHHPMPILGPPPPPNANPGAPPPPNAAVWVQQLNTGGATIEVVPVSGPDIECMKEVIIELKRKEALRPMAKQIQGQLITVQ